MSADANTFNLGLTPNTVRSADGKVLTVPKGWVLLPPGDVALTRAKSHLHILHPHRYYFHNHRKSDQHSYSQRTRFIPDELLPWFEPVTTGRATLEIPQGDAAGDVTTADVRRRIGRMWT